MASGHYHHHHHQQQQKISPRKFSEKIALLNKKEAEGNAEFEEIIKEVQATRSGHTCAQSTGSGSTASRKGRAVAAARTSSNEELEEVYQNLIRSCMSDDYNGEQQTSTMITSSDANAQFQDQHLHQSARSRSAEISRRPLSDQHRPLIEQPASSSTLAFAHQPINQVASTCDLTTTDNSNHLYQATATEARKPNQTGASNFSGTSAIQQPFYSSQETTLCSSTQQCRNRVASFGGSIGQTIPRNCTPNVQHSSNHLNTTCGYVDFAQQQQQQQQLQQHQPSNNWTLTASSADMYLKPTCDKAWQKSCSDPTLHVNLSRDSFAQNQPLSECWNANSNSSNNLLAEPMAVDHQSNNNQEFPAVPKASALDCGQQMSSSSTAVAAVAPDTSSCMAVDCSLDSQQQQHLTGIGNRSSSPADPQVVESSTMMCCQHLSNSSVSVPATNAALDGDNSSINMSSVPGIKICNIDEVNLQLKSTVLEAEGTDKLIGANNQQFVISEEKVSSSQQQQQQQQQVETGIFASGRDGLSHISSEHCHDNFQVETQDWPPVVCAQQAPYSMQVDFSNISTNWPIEGGGAKITSTHHSKRAISGSQSTLMNDAPVSLMMTTFPPTGTQPSSNNISRSRSHNNIDNLRKAHQKDTVSSNYSSCNINQQAACRIPSWYGDTINNYYEAQTGQGMRECLSSLSMKPQYGSISPIESSSNLTSPKSEQNSPRSSLTEYVEYLPFEICDQ